MKIGDRVRLPPSLSQPEGEYRVVAVDDNSLLARRPELRRIAALFRTTPEEHRCDSAEFRERVIMTADFTKLEVDAEGSASVPFSPPPRGGDLKANATLTSR